MKLRKLLLLGAMTGVALVMSPGAQAALTGWDTGGLASAYLRWDRANNPDEVTYRVLRDDIEVGKDIKRCQFIDTGVTEGSHTWTVQVYRNGNFEREEKITFNIGARDFSKPLLTLDVEYELTLDEIMSDGATVNAYSLQTSSSSIKVPGKGYVNNSGNYTINFGSWKNQGRSSDGHNTNFRTYSHWPSNNENDYILDGNRYIWLKDMKRFTVKNDWLDNGEWASAEAYPWAGHGYSWRAMDSGVENGSGYYERCWYIAIKEPAASLVGNEAENQPYTDGKYGVLCVWGPDNIGHRPYEGAPFFQSYSQFYINLPDRNGKNETVVASFAKPNGKAGKYNSDAAWSYYNNSSYGLAFSEDGRSYVHRTGDHYDTYTNAPNKDQFWLIHPAKEDGSQQMWSPRRLALTTAKASSIIELPRSPGRRCDLPSVKGNLHYYNKEGDQNAAQMYAWLWLIPRYTNSTDAINIRRERIINGNSQATYDADGKLSSNTQSGYGYNRINISGWNALGGMTCEQSYVIPMAGYEREDVFFQFHQNTNTNISPLYYMGHNKLKDMTWGQGSTAGGAWEKKITVNDLQKIELSVDHFDTAGGCTFEFKGSKYLVLPANRQANRNFGDFSIYRVDINDGAGTVNLVPVFDYKVQKESYRWEKDNVHRVFFKAYAYDDDVQIYSYLPGRQIRMYTIHAYDVQPTTPSVEVRPVHRDLPDSYRNQGYNASHSHDNGAYKDFNQFAAYGKWSEPASSGRWDDAWNGWANTAKDGWYIWKYKTEWYQNGNWLAGENYYPNNGSRQYDQQGTNVNSAVYKMRVQPIYRRRHLGQYEQAVGDVREATGQFSYTPQAPNVEVKVFEGSGDVSNLYRVDINFNRVEAWSNGHRMSPTRYEVSIGPKNQGQDNNTCQPPVSKTPGMSFHDMALVHVGWENPRDDFEGAAVTTHHYYDKVQRTGNWVNILGDYNFDQTNNGNGWRLVHNESSGQQNEAGATNSVLSFFVDKSSGFDPYNYTYHVKACYGGDNWSNGDVAKVATGSANAIYSGMTAVNDIMGDSDAGVSRYYNMQGVEVAFKDLTTGVYIMVNNRGSKKVYITR
ncbi:MAG: hypothetical protein J6C44_01860 [Muribaculaceae bacterium]|nr:hypothetical protein [Muribaculaceae bacterium]